MRIIFLLAALLISACTATPPPPSIPEGTPRASIQDTFIRQNRSSAIAFVAEKINSSSIHNATYNTQVYGSGPVLQTVHGLRDVRIEPLTIILTGTNLHGAPINSMLGDNHYVSGSVEFTPEKDKKYFVKGKLDEDYSAVWIENFEGKIVSKIVEKTGKNIEQATAVKQTLLHQKNSTKPKTPYEFFLQITPGDNSEQVISRLGPPDQIKHHGSNFMSSRPETDDYIYNKLGLIRLWKQGGNFYVHSVKVKSQNKPLTQEEIKGLLAASEGKALPKVAKRVYKSDVDDINTLDLIAHKIWSTRHSENDYTIDGSAWLCKTLTQANNPRYRSMLEKLSKEASARKLRKYALLAYESLPPKDTPQYLTLER